eukprot:6879049-Heterocapsa_arctica.AAC.1
MQQLMSEGAEQAQIERESRGLGGAAAGVPVGAAAVAVAPPTVGGTTLAVAVPLALGAGTVAPAVGPGAAGAAPAAPRLAGPAGCWVLDEPIVGHEAPR